MAKNNLVGDSRINHRIDRGLLGVGGENGLNPEKLSVMLPAVRLAISLPFSVLLSGQRIAR